MSIRSLIRNCKYLATFGHVYILQYKAYFIEQSIGLSAGLNLNIRLKIKDNLPLRQYSSNLVTINIFSTWLIQFYICKKIT